MPLAKRTSKNQITLPKKIAEAFPTEYFDVSVDRGVIILRPVVVESPGERLQKVREKIRRLGLAEESVEEAVR